MNVSGEIKGLDKLQKAMKSTIKSSEEVVEQRVKTAAVEIHGRVVRAIQKTSSGEQQRRSSFGRRTRTVVASKPGDPPNTDTGALVQSYKWLFNKMKMEAIIGSGLIYSKWLEFGTKDMKARPVLGPAFRGYLGKLKNKRFPKLKAKV